jgi:hypothetical protein
MGHPGTLGLNANFELALSGRNQSVGRVIGCCSQSYVSIYVGAPRGAIGVLLRSPPHIPSDSNPNPPQGSSCDGELP